MTPTVLSIKTEILKVTLKALGAYLSFLTSDLSLHLCTPITRVFFSV